MLTSFFRFAEVTPSPRPCSVPNSAWDHAATLSSATPQLSVQRPYSSICRSHRRLELASAHDYGLTSSAPARRNRCRARQVRLAPWCGKAAKSVWSNLDLCRSHTPRGSRSAFDIFSTVSTASGTKRILFRPAHRQDRNPSSSTARTTRLFSPDILEPLTYLPVKADGWRPRSTCATSPRARLLPGAQTNIVHVDESGSPDACFLS